MTAPLGWSAAVVAPALNSNSYVRCFMVLRAYNRSTSKMADVCRIAIRSIAYGEGEATHIHTLRVNDRVSPKQNMWGGVEERRVCQYRRAGVRVMPRPTILTQAALAHVTSLVDQGRSAAEIASEIGCTLGTLRVRCSQHKISSWASRYK